jgi:hypothetical protein
VLALAVALAAWSSCGDSGGPAVNPTHLWLTGVSGSERNLQLAETGPPNPF